MMNDTLRMRLETLAIGLAQKWPLQHDGTCRYCGAQSRIPGPQCDQYDAAKMLLEENYHEKSCNWVWAREIVKLLG